jgi:Ni/Fe-hydrogenase subunit HybB-like protein
MAENRPLSDAIGLVAIIAVAVCLIPAGAHLFELPNKMALAPSDYMTAQQIYSGWALFGIAIHAAIAFTLAHALVAWRDRRARWLSLSGLAAILVTQAIFWTYTFPMNALTKNWTVAPDDFEAVRRQWEYSHAANAGLTFLALVLIVAAVLARRGAEG